MAEEKYGIKYTKEERNVMWTIAFVILLLVLVFWGLWYFNSPAATETGAAAEEAAPAAAETPATAEAPAGTESAGTTGTAISGEAMPETTSPTTTTTGQTY